MSLFFLPQDLRDALSNLNINLLSEIRLRSGQPVIIQYGGEYKYINRLSVSDDPSHALVCVSAERILNSAMEKSVYAYAEQLKKGFITVDGGVRIGVAGEYVTQGDTVIAVKGVTSLNIRIPHEVVGIADKLSEAIFSDGLKSTLIFSPPGYGKTTLLRELTRKLSVGGKFNILVFDERNELSASNGEKIGFELGPNCDVIRGATKIRAFENAVRALRPQVIITDELGGSDDIAATRYAAECGITIFASSHTQDREMLKKLPFELFVELTGIGKTAVVYDKNFNFICNCATVGRVGGGNIGR